MQLLTLKPHFLREVAFYQAHVRSDSLGRGAHFLGTAECSADYTAFCWFSSNSNISSEICVKSNKTGS